jgi:hypothetical protein
LFLKLFTYEKNKVNEGLGGNESHDKGETYDDGVGYGSHVWGQQLRSHHLNKLKGLRHEIDFKNSTEIDIFTPEEGTRKVLNIFQRLL